MAADPPPERSRSFCDQAAPGRYRRYLLQSLFEPWAADLVARAELAPGARVLDVASGLGPVARQAAAAVGRSGAVEATDISDAMLGGARELDPGPPGAPITYAARSAAEIGGPDGRFDAVLCQQGLQFFPDRQAALVEMHRVARPGGTLALSSWAAEEPMALLVSMGEVLEEMGEAEPYPAAFRPATYALSRPELRSALERAGWSGVRVERVRLATTWPDAGAVLDAVLGTPFGPIVQALDARRLGRFRQALVGRLGLDPSGSGPVEPPTSSNVALARA